jgi:ankyrin repeat protein
VKHLLEHDNYHKDDSLRESFRRSCIIAAKSREVALLILDKGFDIHGASGKEGKTLLMDVRTPEVVDTLIDKGARLEDTDDQGRTALMLATTAEMVKLLIDRGAKLEAKDQQGRTALMAALEYDEESEPIARVLIERGANIEARDKEGRSILTTAIWKGRLALLKLLINNGVNVSAIDDRGRNAFHHLTSDKRRNYEYRPHRQSGRKQTQQDRDQEIIDILLRSKVDPSATDRHDRTCIHWAAGNGNSGLLKLLLKTGKFNINAVERRRKTPLHLAAASSCIIDKPILGKDGKVKNPSPNGHFHTMLVLLDHGASVTAQSDGDWTPLHNACWNNADSRETVGVLLRHVHGAERHSKNRNGRTPLHIAAHAGNLRVVDYLLKRRDVKRHERDIFGNTPLLYAASLPQKSPEDRKKRDAVMDLLASWNNAGVLSSEAREASKLFQATIVDFEASDKGSTPRPGGHAPKKVSVFDLLYNPRVGNQHVSTQANDGSENFRWIHLPANNVSWCLDLIADYFISNRASDVSSFKALERSFNHQHRGSRRHSHYMTPLCQTVIRSGHGDQRTLATEIELQRGMSQESTLTDEHSESPFRPDSMQGILGIDSNILTNSPRLLAKDGIHQPPVSLEPRREVKPKSSTEEVSISDAYLFMPYIYYETQEHRDKMVCTYEGWQEVQDCNPKIAGTAHIHAIQKNTNQRDLSSPTTDKHDLLFRAHCKTPETPLHIRRTLDQFFYHNIDTSERDKDQVLHRYQGVVQKIEPHLHKVLMVDQLWMVSMLANNV